MKRIEAMALLAACKPLADRLAGQGVNIELTDADRAALTGFKRVWSYDEGWWLDDPDIHRQAGLGRSDIGALSFIAARKADLQIRRQHNEGETLD